MRELVIKTTENIFDLPDKSGNMAVCVTTNGIIKTNGDAVMGKGIAKEANQRFHLAGALAKHLREDGNTPFNFGVYQSGNSKFHVISFPTKWDWKNDSDLDLIQASALLLLKICNETNITTCYLPPVGCGLGSLDYSKQVKPLLEFILDDRFVVVLRDDKANSAQYTGKTLCFTGRRPKDLCGYKKEKYKNLVDCITKFCDYFYKQGYRNFISGGAQGFDQLAFWAVNKLKASHPDIKNIVYVPFKGQERNWLATGLFSRQEYRLMLSLADEVVYLQDELHDYKDIAKALFARNHAMVDASDAVIALYPDNTWPTSKGGTAECMRYAETHHKDIHQIDYTIANNEITIHMNLMNV